MNSKLFDVMYNDALFLYFRTIISLLLPGFTYLYFEQYDILLAKDVFMLICLSLFYSMPLFVLSELKIIIMADTLVSKFRDHPKPGLAIMGFQTSLTIFAYCVLLVSYYLLNFVMPWKIEFLWIIYYFPLFLITIKLLDCYFLPNLKKKINMLQK